MCGCRPYFHGCIVQLLHELYSLLTSLWGLVGALSFCLLGKRCPLPRRLRQLLRFGAGCLVGVAVGVLVPNMPRGNRAVGTTSSDVFDARYSL